MKAGRERTWFFVHLHCFLVGSLVDSSSLSSAVSVSVSSKVGDQAVLPCSWKQRLGETPAAASCHVQWTSPLDTVFELRGQQTWEADEYQGRLQVPQDRLGTGDCSLIISDVQIGDSGRYESFMVVDGRMSKTRVFIQSVKLSVSDHKSLQSRGPGEDLVLDLYTSQSVRLVFQERSRSDWSVLWVRGDENSARLEKHPQNEQLTFRHLNSSDQGTYKVLDQHGLAVSTVQLAVEEHSTALKSLQTLENQDPADDSSGSSALVASFLLVTVFQILQL